MKAALTQLEHAIASLGYTIRCGSEIECYFSGGDEGKDAELLALILFGAREKGILLHALDKESGDRQYEAALPFADSAQADIRQQEALKEIIQSATETAGTKALFAAKPFDNQPGCGLHLNLSLLEERGRNVFLRPAPQQESSVLEQCAAGVLSLLPALTWLCCKDDACFARYHQVKNEGDFTANPIQAYNNAPTHICWGGNNRTLALRVPPSTMEPENRHLEFRVPSPACDPASAWFAFLLGVYYGLTHSDLDVPEKIFGNAYDPQYDLEPLPQTREESRRHWGESKIIPQLLEELGIAVIPT